MSDSVPSEVRDALEVIDGAIAAARRKGVTPPSPPEQGWTPSGPPPTGPAPYVTAEGPDAPPRKAPEGAYLTIEGV